MSDVLPAASPDEAIVQLAARDARVILTQDLDFSAIIALRGEPSPSLISLRFSSSRVEHVNAVLDRILPQVEAAVMTGSIVTVEDWRIRIRLLPPAAASRRSLP